MTESIIQFATSSDQLPHDSVGNEVNSGCNALEAHIAKISIANSSGALKRQFHDIVVAKSEKSIT